MARPETPTTSLATAPSLILGTRDLRKRPGYVRDLMPDDKLVLTSNGKPVALLIGIGEDELDDTIRAIERAKAQLALSRMRREAAARGVDRLSPREIDAEIRAVRSARTSA